MRILVVHPRMSIKGGGERVAIHTMLASLGRGDDVTLLSEEFDVKDFEDFFGCVGLLNRISRLTYPPFKPILGRGLLLYQRLYYYQHEFRRVLPGRSRFDLVLGTQDVGYTPSINASILQYCYFPEYFSHLHSNPSSPLWKIYYQPARFFYRNRANLIHQFLSTSDYTRSFVKKIWGRDSTTLYPPCPIDLYGSLQAQKENLVVTVGRIVPDKRMHLLVEIARRLPMFRFVIVGSVDPKGDAYFNSLKKNAPANVSIVLSPLRRVRDILAKAKVYVHCMENEHFGITLVEAMAAGCVPVVHDSGGPKEIVTSNVGYRWRTLQEATDQVSSLMNNEESRERFSKASSERALQFSAEAFEASISSIMRAYEQ